MSRANFQMCVAIKFEKFNRGPEQRGGFFCLGGPLFRCAVGAGFATRANDEMRFAPGLGFARDNAAAAEFDVVGMRAKGQQRRASSGEFNVGFIGAVNGVAVDKCDFRRFFGAKIIFLARAGNVMRAMDHGLHPAQPRVARRD